MTSEPGFALPFHRFRRSPFGNYYNAEFFTLAISLVILAITASILYGISGIRITSALPENRRAKQSNRR
jgi:hypothetical protein